MIKQFFFLFSVLQGNYTKKKVDDVEFGWLFVQQVMS